MKRHQSLPQLRSPLSSSPLLPLLPIACRCCYPPATHLLPLLFPTADHHLPLLLNHNRSHILLTTSAQSVASPWSCPPLSPSPLLPLLPTAYRRCYPPATYLPSLLCNNRAILNPFPSLPIANPLLQPFAACSPTTIAASTCVASLPFPTRRLYFLLPQRTHASALAVAARSFFPTDAQQRRLYFLLPQRTHAFFNSSRNRHGSKPHFLQHRSPLLPLLLHPLLPCSQSCLPLLPPPLTANALLNHNLPSSLAIAANRRCHLLAAPTVGAANCHYHSSYCRNRRQLLLPPTVASRCLLYLLPCSNNCSHSPHRPLVAVISSPCCSAAIFLTFLPSLPVSSRASAASSFLPDHCRCHLLPLLISRHLPPRAATFHYHFHSSPYRCSPLALQLQPRHQLCCPSFSLCRGRTSAITATVDH
ncbi:hypothetical protein BHM03_00048176 [Ensete ventricosum]|nr:hypothetical protein BHM03_00048176 [Ensete ventricosum]